MYKWKEKENLENQILSHIMRNQEVPKLKWYKEERWLIRYGFEMLIN
jgi:hypothetical protein